MSWKLISKEKVEVEFRKELQDFAAMLVDKEIEEPLPVAIGQEALQVIKRFCEAHHYDPNQVRLTKPIVSSIPSQNMDQESYSILQLPGQDDMFDQVLAASYYLDAKLLTQACLTIMSMNVYFGDTEADLAQAQSKYGLGNITPQEELAIMQEFGPAFQDLHEKFRSQLQQNEEQFRLLKDA